MTETVSTLAHMSRFIIADVTDAKSIPQEFQALIPNRPSVPVRLLVQRGAKEYALIGHFKRYPWVIDTYQYEDIPQLIASLNQVFIEPAGQMVEQLREK